MDDLARFLDQQIASELWLAGDERRTLTPPPLPSGKGFYPPPVLGPFRYTFNPARVETDCETRRTLLRAAEDHDVTRDELLRAFGEAYRSHPDFDPGWLLKD